MFWVWLIIVALVSFSVFLLFEIPPRSRRPPKDNQKPLDKGAE
jgi:hypothetical protein